MMKSPDASGGVGMSEGSDFRFVVDSKANKSELDELRLQKANKTDIEHILEWIKLLHN